MLQQKLEISYGCFLLAKKLKISAYSTEGQYRNYCNYW